MADGPVFQRWTAADIQYLRDNWERRDVATIARVLKRSEDAVRQRAYKLFGTTIDRDPKPGRIRGRHKGFKPGNWGRPRK